MSDKQHTAGLSGTLRLYLHYISINIRSMMQYKTSFLLSTIGQFLVSFNTMLGIYFMFRRFHRVEGFTYSEVILCYAIVLLQFSLAEMWARGFDSFSGIVRSGSFDRDLVRPRSVVLQVLGEKFELTRIGRLIQAVIMFAYAIYTTDVVWTFRRILTVIFMVFCGMLLFSAMFLIYAAFCFFTLDGLEFMNIFTDGAREYGKYPLGVYGKRLLQITTFLVPYALIQYYPFLYVLGRVSSPVYIFLPFLSLLFLIPAYAFWRYGVSRYQSSGS